MFIMKVSNVESFNVPYLKKVHKQKASYSFETRLYVPARRITKKQPAFLKPKYHYIYK